MIVLAGLFPFTVGTYFFITNLKSSNFNMVSHVAFTTLISLGVTISTLGYFGLAKASENWVVMLLMFIVIWSGGNDSYALLRSHFLGSNVFPFAVIPTTLGMIAIFLITLDIKNEQ